jgi:hypothetical protein
MNVSTDFDLSMSFPNETPEYRAARDALLASEIALHRQMEAVALMRCLIVDAARVHDDQSRVACAFTGRRADVDVVLRWTLRRSPPLRCDASQLSADFSKILDEMVRFNRPRAAVKIHHFH